VAAGDAYIAIDPSARMLARFAEKATNRDGPRPALVQGDGQSLPFPEATFDAVLIVQVVSGLPGWRRLLAEARRVLRPEGGLVFGQRIAPEDGLDARMRSQLSLILAELGVEPSRPGGSRGDTRQWMVTASRRMEEVVAARWEVTRSPRDFLDRHATGARFAALPQSVRDEAMRRLTHWSLGTFGELDAEFIESHAFVLDICII
jgi:SAM-dependent methyltransferase